jgi:hypothetical protein
VKDPGLELGFDPVLDRIQYLAENGLTSLMVLHDFLSKRLVPLQDRSHRPALMYTRVNDIMRLDCGPGSSLDEVLLAASLKALTTDQFSDKLVVSAAVCEPICVNQVVRTTLLATMPTLDDVDITLVQRGDQSHGVVIPGHGALVDTAGGHVHGGGPSTGRGGVSVGGSPIGRRSGAPVGGRGGSPAGGSGSALASGKGKHACIILDDNEVSSDEDEPLQKQLRRLPSAGSSSTALDEVAVADKEATAKRVMEEAILKAAIDEEVTGKTVDEVVMKATVDEEVAGKTADEAAGAVRDSPPPSQAPKVVGTKMAVAPSGSTLPAKRPYRGVWKSRYVKLPFFFFFFPVGLHFLITSPFCPAPLPPAQPP